MVKSIKNWAIIVLTVFVILASLDAYIMTKRYNKERASRERLWQNYVELENKNKYLIASQQEWRRVMSKQYDSVLKLLKIKPKEVIRYEERVITQVERDTVFVAVKETPPRTWQIVDKGPCFIWQGEASLPPSGVLEVKRTGFDYNNETVDVLTRVVKKRILFFKIYDKNRFAIHTTSQCGGSSTKIIEVER